MPRELARTNRRFELRLSVQEFETWKKAAEPWSIAHWARIVLNDAAMKQANELIQQRAEIRMRHREATMQHMGKGNFEPDWK